MGGQLRAWAALALVGGLLATRPLVAQERGAAVKDQGMMRDMMSMMGDGRIEDCSCAAPFRQQLPPLVRMDTKGTDRTGGGYPRAGAVTFPVTNPMRACQRWQT